MFTLPPLPYSHSDLEPYLDSQTLELHHGKHHAGYVKNLNAALQDFPDLLSQPVEQLLQHLPQLPESVRTSIVNHGGGHANHSLFWTVMAPPAESAPSGSLATAIQTAFGSFSAFQEKFTAAAMGQFGSGWAWLVADSGRLSLVSTPNQVSPLSSGQTPLLALDVWEHAYYLKYQNRRADYISAWWHVVNWPAVDQLFASLQP